MKVKLAFGRTAVGFTPDTVYKRVTVLSEDDPLIPIIGGRILIKNDLDHLVGITESGLFVANIVIDDPEEIAAGLAREGLTGVTGYRRKDPQRAVEFWQDNSFKTPTIYTRRSNGVMVAQFPNGNKYIPIELRVLRTHFEFAYDITVGVT